MFAAAISAVIAAIAEGDNVAGAAKIACGCKRGDPAKETLYGDELPPMAKDTERSTGTGVGVVDEGEASADVPNASGAPVGEAAPPGTAPPIDIAAPAAGLAPAACAPAGVAFAGCAALRACPAAALPPEAVAAAGVVDAEEPGAAVGASPAVATAFFLEHTAPIRALLEMHTRSLSADNGVFATRDRLAFTAPSLTQLDECRWSNSRAYSTLREQCGKWAGEPSASF